MNHLGNERIASMPEQEGDECQEDIEQVRLDASLVEDVEPGEQPGRKAERRQHGPVEHGVGHVAVESGLLRERAASPPVRWTCGRSAQPNRPTSIWANDDDVYCMRAVGAA